MSISFSFDILDFDGEIVIATKSGKTDSCSCGTKGNAGKDNTVVVVDVDVDI